MINVTFFYLFRNLQQDLLLARVQLYFIVQKMFHYCATYMPIFLKILTIILHSFIHLLNTVSVSGNILDPGDTIVNKIDLRLNSNN